MDRVKVLIVEDEIIISHGIKLSLQNNGYNVIGQAINYTEAIEFINSQNPDIAILDIKLSGRKTGIDLAEEINKKYEIPFIFLTSNTDKLTVEEVKQVNPSAYLVKPFEDTEIATSIELALYNYAKRNEKAFSQDNLIIKDCLFVKVEKSFIRVDFSDIFYLKSAHIYIEIFLTDGTKHVVRGSLNEYINKLTRHFFRCHRSYIINVNFVSRINPNAIIIKDTEIPMGKKNKEELLELLNKT